MIKLCKSHGLTEFSLRKNGDKKETWRCKKCTVNAVQKRREKIKIMAIEYKGGKCCICGYKKYPGALEFHHTNNDKEFSISRYGHSRSWNRVKNEIDKCVLLCSNCHKEIHGDVIKLDFNKVNDYVCNDLTPILIPKKINYCVDCNIEIDKYGVRCVKCSNISRRKIKNRPEKHLLIEELKNMTYTSLGKKYGVTDKTIKKWIK
jgi:hypothetical protein